MGTTRVVVSLCLVAATACGGDDEVAQHAAEPTPRVRELCSAYALERFECGYWSSTDECEQSFSLWADEVLDQVAACVAEPSCDAFEACMETVFPS